MSMKERFEWVRHNILAGEDNSAKRFLARVAERQDRDPVPVLPAPTVEKTRAMIDRMMTEPLPSKCTASKPPATVSEGLIERPQAAPSPSKTTGPLMWDPNDPETPLVPGQDERKD